MLKRVRQHYDTHYSGLPSIEQRPTKRPSRLDLHLKRVPVDEDQFDAYVKGVPTEITAPVELNILAWWAQSPFTKLRQMAYDLLSIPATSCAIERVFSSAKDLLSADQSRMKDTTIEARELLRNWWLHDLVQQYHQHHR